VAGLGAAGAVVLAIVGVTTGCVMASAFRAMCLPWNPTVKIAIRAATTTTAIEMIAVRLPLLISSSLWLLLIARESFMDRS
jgi:hypothetical protein